MTAPEELDRLAKVAFAAASGAPELINDNDWQSADDGVQDAWRAAVSAVLEAQGPLSLASLIDQHGAAAVHAELFALADRLSRVYGPWTKSDSGQWSRYSPIRNHRMWVHTLHHHDFKFWRVGDNDVDYETAEEAQSACDAALRAAGAVLVE